MTAQWRTRCILMLTLAWSSAAHALDVCVETVPEIVAAFAAWDDQPEGTVLTIKVVQGSYNVGASLGGDRGSYAGFKLLGGYTANCASRTLNPANTTIDGNNQAESGISLTTHGDANIYIEGLTFTRLIGSTQVNLNGAAFDLTAGQGESDVAYYAIRHCRFTRSSGQRIVLLKAPQMRVINSQISDNTLLPGGAALWIAYGYQADSGAAVNNSTIANNSGIGLQVDSHDDYQSPRISEVADNILWGNSGGDLNLIPFNVQENTLLLHGNLVGNILGALPSGQNNNIAVNPQFISAAAGNYGLALASPAINSGSAYQRYGFPSIDLVGGNRVVGTSIDRGAFESSVDNRTTFVVTNGGDNGNNSSPLDGSLRAAIRAANLSTAPYTIRFAISGPCPRVINMNTPMLDVSGDVTIDARSQTSWVANTGNGVFNANLCIVLNGSGAAPYAFRVPSGASNARLALHGMMFAGFTDAAVRLEDGSNHRISGNQFGAVPFTAANRNAIRVTGAADSSYIGGSTDDPAVVNLIAGSSDAGIYLDNPAGGTIVSNNLIGYQPNGSSNGGNQIGIFVFNSPANHIAQNSIGHSAATAITLSGAASDGNILQYNTLGTAAAGIPPGNQGAGISVIFAARNSTIGAPLTSRFGGNLIFRSSGPGVWISPTGGAGNRVLGNRFLDNGAVDIDLAVSGPSANQSTNPATGPNRLQNYPRVDSAVRANAASPTLLASGSLQSIPVSTFRLDFYAGNGCDSSAPGRGKAYVVSNTTGDASFALTVAAPPASATNLTHITATATTSSGDTSEVGSCAALTIAPLPEPLFMSGFE